MRVLKPLLLTTAVVSLFGLLADADAQDRVPRTQSLFEYHDAPRFRESESHPLRIAAYVLHPVGWLAQELVTRPLSAIAGSSRPTKVIMGFREPYDYRATNCFSSSEAIPDCRSLSPFNYGFVESERAERFEQDYDDRVKVDFPNVNFDFDKSTLNKAGKAQVARISEILETDDRVEGVAIVLEGHADEVGTEEYNMVLAKKRAESVKKALALRGISESRMKTVSYGESRPLINEDTAAAKAANRRVEVQVD